MKLTPIRVKGKGGQKKIWKAPDPQRVLKRQRSEDGTGDGSEGGKRRRRLGTKKPPAPIELLPSEILERIFFMSMNFNFLRSSYRLGYRFSSKSFLVGLVEDAFAPTWDLWFGCPRSQIHSYDGFLRDHERFGGDPSTQDAVLDLPWINVTVILEAQQRWYRKRGAGRYFEHIKPLTFTPTHSLGGFDHAKDVAACFEADWDEFTDAYSVLLSGVPIEWDAIRATPLKEAKYLDVHTMTSIPDHLMRGPFDLDKAKLLFWLVRGGARLGRQTGWETTKCGYENIMTLGDTRLAVYILGLFHTLNVVYGHWPEFVREEKLEETKRKYESCDPQTPAARLWWFARKFLRDSEEYLDTAESRHSFRQYKLSSQWTQLQRTQ